MTHTHGDRITPLENEHKEIMRQLDLVRNEMMASPRQSRGKPGESIGLLKSMLEKHLMNEESTLYEPLRLRLGRNGPVDAMTREHRSIGRALGRLLSASDEYSAGRIRIGDLKLHFNSCRKEIGEHIEKEEKVLLAGRLEVVKSAFAQ